MSTTTEPKPVLEEGLLENDQLKNKEPEEKKKKTLKDFNWELLALCIAVLTQVYMLISCFSYVPLMCIFLVDGLTEQNAGTYAGIISAMFMIGRAFSSYTWGTAADKLGRKPVFYLSYILSIIFTLIFGSSQNIYVAVISRFFLGASNGLVSVVKTMCTELAQGDKELEGKIMGFAFGMRGWGFLLSPALAGVISDPLSQYPNSYLSLTYPIFFAKYPYILPNIVGALLCFAGLITAYLYLPETKPENISVRRRTEVSMKTIWANPSTRDHLITYWISVFCSQFNLEALPLFFIATDGGLSLREATIGAVLSGAGLVYGIMLFLTYFPLMEKYGLYGTMRLCTLFGSNLAILTPFATFLNQGSKPNTLTIWSYLYLVAVQGTLRVGTGIMYTVASLGCNQSVPSDEIAAMNGLSMFGASITQAVGPIAAGFSTAWALDSSYIDPDYGAYIPFAIVSACATFLVFWVFTRLKQYHQD